MTVPWSPAHLGGLPWLQEQEDADLQQRGEDLEPHEFHGEQLTVAMDVATCACPSPSRLPVDIMIQRYAKIIKDIQR